VPKPALLLLLLATALAAPAIEVPQASAAALESGIETQYFDPSVRAQDDFYLHVNGKWIQQTEIPADKSGYGPAYQLNDEAQLQLRAIIEAAAKATDRAPGSEAQKIGDLYASFMDEARLEQLGAKPLQPEFARIDAMKSKADIPRLMAHLSEIGVSGPLETYIDQDSRESTRYVAEVGQGGLGLPDRDYYLSETDAKLKAIRAEYLQHIEKMLALAGDKTAAEDARAVLELETALARAQCTKVQNRDPVKTYNKVALAELPTLAPDFDWKSYLAASKLTGKIDSLIVNQPTYVGGFDKVLQSTPLPVWKAYFKWQLLHAYGNDLSKEFADESFRFNRTIVRGIPENLPRWKRGVNLVEHAIGEAVGKIYVQKNFPPSSKARMEKLVSNLIEAYRESIVTLDWMGPDTKREAQAKLSKLTVKIGYPDKWRDYSKLRIDRNDLVGNVMRANAFESDRNVAKLGKPIDRSEWFMTPQTVNAYYNASMNEIVFPAAYLRPPYFNPDAEDATNYGGVGATIGHEISHGFDDSGSQFDGDGNLRDWWTKEDHERFDAKTKALVAQYNAYVPVKGYTVNGELTLGENIADNSGLAIAYKAYRISLKGKEAPVMDGFTGDQRFFLSYAQGWRDKIRDEQQIMYLKSDPHTPDRFRCNGTLVNLDPFYTAFDVKPGDKMYLEPEKRVHIW